MEMIEKVARAIYAAAQAEAVKRGCKVTLPTYDTDDEDARSSCVVLAEAAITAYNPQPIPMLLYCPQCGQGHVDEPDERTPEWTNPPHRSHLCHDCGCIWRPADVPTNGVASIKTQGKADTWTAERGNAESALNERLREALEEVVAAQQETNDEAERVKQPGANAWSSAPMVRLVHAHRKAAALLAELDAALSHKE